MCQVNYEQEEKLSQGIIQNCEICTNLILDYVRQQNGSLPTITVEEIVMAIFKVEIQHRENLLHIRLAKASLP